jgi:hypothetical protein
VRARFPATGIHPDRTPTTGALVHEIDGFAFNNTCLLWTATGSNIFRFSGGSGRRAAGPPGRNSTEAMT